jgi:hypothetical protein
MNKINLKKVLFFLLILFILTTVVYVYDKKIFSDFNLGFIENESRYNTIIILLSPLIRLMTNNGFSSFWVVVVGLILSFLIIFLPIFILFKIIFGKNFKFKSFFLFLSSLPLRKKVEIIIFIISGFLIAWLFFSVSMHDTAPRFLMNIVDKITIFLGNIGIIK